MKYLFTLLMVAFFFSCDKNKENKDQNEEDKPLLSVIHTFTSVKKINVVFNKEIEDWSELSAVESFLSRFKKVSPKEVLSNALELKGLVKSLKDSIKPVLFDIPSFNARVNILYNETLRLSDMVTIRAIKADEVNKQTEKIIEAFSAVNSKVNTILSKKKFEDEIDVDIQFIGLDSTKIDSVSRKSINENLQRKLEEKSKRQ